MHGFIGVYAVEVLLAALDPKEVSWKDLRTSSQHPYAQHMYCQVDTLLTYERYK